MAKASESKAQLQYVSPELLDFDPSNPRFAGLLAGRTQEEIQKEIYDEPYYASALVDSLLENGYIDYEPLVVRKNKNRYVVVEGNRRLAAIKEIRSHLDRYEGRKSDLEQIPVLIFPEKPDEQQHNEMRVYLGVRHLLGFREWPPLSKAQFLENESKKPGGLDGVLKETRMTKQAARRFLVPYRLLKAAGANLPPGEDFWVLGEALQRAGIKKYVQLEVDPKTLRIEGYDKKHLSLLLADLYGPKKGDRRDASAKVVYDTRDLSRLSKVLGSERASSALRAGRGLDEAEIYVDSREESLARLAKVMKELGVLLKKVLPLRSHERLRVLDSYKTLDSAVKGFVKRSSE